MKESSKNSEQLNKKFLQTYPYIKADCYIPIGIKCRVAERLRENNLRLCSLPFDWLAGFSLDFVIETINHGVDTWFVDYVEDNSKADKKHRCLYDIKNKFRFRHIFPKNQSIEEYMPEFRKVFSRRYARFMKILDNSQHICFVCNNRNMPLDDFAIPNVIDDNQTDTIKDFHNFLKKIKKIYPDKQFSLVHVEHNSDKKEIVEYSYADNITIYNLKTFDTVATDDTSTSSWKGNSKTWKNICSNLELTSRNIQSMVAVKNADGDPDTTADIVVQNHVEYTPKVSVIIPVYNVDAYLRECLDSVINQTLKDIEIICVDDGSTDKSLDILKEYAAKDNRITVLKQQNLHAGVARNAGLAVAKGKYLSFLDSDDFFELNMLEEMYHKAEEDASDVVVCGYYKYDQQLGEDTINRSIHQTLLSKSPFIPAEFGANLFAVCYAAAWSKLIKRSLLIEQNIKFESLKNCNDLTCIYSAIAIAQKVSCVDENFVHYRWNTGTQLSTTRFGRNECFILAVAALEKNLHKFGIYNEFYDKMLYTTRKSLRFETQDDIQLLQETAKKHLSQKLYTDLYLPKNKKQNKSPAKQSSYTIKLFSFLPLYRCKQCGGKTDWYILGLPVLKRHKMDNKITTKYYLCGLPFLKISDRIATQNPVIKRKSTSPVNSFIHHDIRANCVLLVEFNNFHGECLIGAAKYFADLGYNVDVCMSASEFKLNPFAEYFSDNVRLFAMDKDGMKNILCHDIMEKYEHIYLNSDFVSNQGQGTPIIDFIGHDIKFPEGKYIIMSHHAEEYDKISPESDKFSIVTLNNLPVLADKQYSMLNTHYFCDYVRNSKNKVINFICIGQIESKRKNHSLLFEAIDSLLKQNITNFKITVIARMGDLSIPKHIKPYLDFKGRLNYHDMYEELKKADFYLTLFDPDNPEHERYLTSGSSGSYQLIYGFSLPCLIPHKFQTPVNGFNDDNSIGYDNNDDLADAMKKAILMPEAEYMQKVNNIKTLADLIYNQSLSNLRNILQIHNKYPTNYFISLGENCFNRTVLTRHNLKQRRENGEMSYPFDLCVCSINATLKNIKNDFSDYFADLYWDSKENIWCNKKYGIRYNHDGDCPQSEKNKLVARYTKRIENFRRLFIDKHEQVFIFSTVNAATNLKNIVELYDTLCLKSSAPVRLLVINLNKDDFQDTEGLNAMAQKGISYAHIPHPYPNYWGEWYKYEFFNSEAGRTFESKYIEFVEQCVNKSN